MYCPQENHGFWDISYFRAAPLGSDIKQQQKKQTNGQEKKSAENVILDLLLVFVQMATFQMIQALSFASSGGVCSPDEFHFFIAATVPCQRQYIKGQPLFRGSY